MDLLAREVAPSELGTSAGATPSGSFVPPRAEPLVGRGFPKSGLRVEPEEDGSRLSYSGRADPLLLYVVFGTAFVVAFGGSIIVSPVYGLAGVMLLSILFLPLLVFAALGALRLSTTCSILRSEQRIAVAERSYAATLRRQWPLDALRSALILIRPPSGFASSASTYDLYLDFGGEQYLVTSSLSERSIRREAQRIARFVGCAVRTERLVAQVRRASIRHVVLVALLFVLPLVGSTVGFAYLLRDQRPTNSLMIVSMSALVVCQVGAILAYGFNRSRAGRAG
ncbi:MAG: hypothetical protein HYX52_00635 [Chloroflexi bacterium]|nr:hypothetical protein [Chloroflexota bacterium]